MTSHISPGPMAHPTFPAWEQFCAGKHTVSNNLMAEQVHAWDWIYFRVAYETNYLGGGGVGMGGKDEGEEDEGEEDGGEGRGGEGRGGGKVAGGRRARGEKEREG